MENGPELIRIVLADDHKLVRAGFRLMLNTLGGVEVLAEASDGQDALELIRKHKPEIALLDITMPGLTGIEIASRIQKDKLSLNVLRATPCDVALLDLVIPKKNGLEVLQQLRENGIDTPVLVLSMHDEDDWAPQVLRAGAAGYLMKNCIPENPVSALRRVARGGRYVTPALAEKLAYGGLERLKHSPA